MVAPLLQFSHFKDAYDVLETIEAQIFSPDTIKGELLLPMIHCNDPKLLLEGMLKLFDQLSPYLPVLLGEYGDPQFRKKLLDTLSPALYNSFASTSYTKTQLRYIFEYQNAAMILDLFLISIQSNMNVKRSTLLDTFFLGLSCSLFLPYLSSIFKIWR